MKVHMLCRNPDDYVRETKKDIHKVPRNYDPDLHPLEAPREYTRALNAVKLERVFAKPFLGSLEGHSDGVHCLCKHPSQLSLLLSGSYDGQIKLWHLGQKTCLQSYVAHTGYTRGLCFHPEGQHFYSVGDDKTIKQWRLQEDITLQHDDQPCNTILGKSAFHDISHHWQQSVYATCGEAVNIWDESRTEPLRTFSWGVDSVHSIRFNNVECNLLGGAASDRSILLYDMRGATPLRKVVLKMKSNSLAWNPMEAFVFTVANEDFNLYTFDLRRLDMPLNVHRDHVSAVLDVDYSPTGREFVSGSYDKTLRIFPVEKGHSREVYHTKRMQRVQCVCWSRDDRYILSGSDEMNIRLWKSHPSQRLGVLRPREREAFNYNDKLKEKFQHHPQVKRIARHRHVPKRVYSAATELRIMRESHKRKEANRRAHSKPGTVPHVPERKRPVVSEKK